MPILVLEMPAIQPKMLDQVWSVGVCRSVHRFVTK